MSRVRLNSLSEWFRIAICACIVGSSCCLPAAAQQLRVPARPTPNSATGLRTIDGVVLSAKTGLPIASAAMTLTRTMDRAPVAETITDQQGRFSFPNLPDGKFSLSAAHRGYIAADYDEHEYSSTAIVTGEGKITTGLEFKLMPQSVLYGVVTEDSGDPVPNASISVYRQDRFRGAGNSVRSAGTSSDDQGYFEISNLAPGNYLLSVKAKPWYATRLPVRAGMLQKGGESPSASPLDVAYPITYFPEATDAADAVPIAVGAGERVPANILLHPMPAIHITMQLPQSSADQPINVPQLRQSILGSEDWVQANVNFIEGGDGSGRPAAVEISGIVPGHYDLVLAGVGGGAEREASLDLASDQAFDLSTAALLADVYGKVALTNPSGGHEKLPPQLYFILSSPQDENHASAQIEPDGTFHISSVHPGTYLMIVTSGSHPMTVTNLIARGATVDGRLLKVGSEPVTLAANIAATTATVSGFAKRHGKPAPGALLLLVPATPDASPATWLVNQSDSDGSFDFLEVQPGTYTLVGIEDGWTLDWATSGSIRSYLAAGLKVTVPAHANDIHLAEAVEVQPK